MYRHNTHLTPPGKNSEKNFYTKLVKKDGKNIFYIRKLHLSFTDLLLFHA